MCHYTLLQATTVPEDSSSISEEINEAVPTATEETSEPVVLAVVDVH
jgi:hypothetical protein